jgi:class 3 adenylate cyclase
LQLGNPELDYITTYGVKNGKIIWKTESGVKLPFAKRYLQTNNLSVLLGKESIEIYLSLQTGSSFYLPLYLGNLKAIADDNHIHDVFNGAVIGIMVVMLLYNFFLFLSVKDKLYLQYCIYLFFSTFLMFYIEGFASDILWRGHPEFNNGIFSNGLVVATTISAIWFSSTFLGMKKNAPYLKWVNYALSLCLISSVAADFSHYPALANKLTQFSSGITTLYLFITGMVLFFKGLKAAKFYILSWGLLMCGGLIYILTLNGVIEINFFTINSFQMASMLEGVFLSFALADRINDLRHEKNKAQKRAIEEARKNEQLIRNQNEILESEVTRRTELLEKEMQKSEKLLLNILPEGVAKELKDNGSTSARLYNEVTVLFTDFVNFTRISETLSPHELVKELDLCFTEIDKIIEKHELEKIKTIGDSYLAVCGLPAEDKEHAVKAVKAALEIRDFIQHNVNQGGKFEIRIGLHSGPVVAGIVGYKKFAYDIWGDTVNTASRMESSGEKGKVNISETTFNLVNKHFHCIARGEVEAKHKGKIAMYFVEKEAKDQHPPQ